MYKTTGCFGVLNIDEPDFPLLLCDGGVEYREGEAYAFDNLNRPDFQGFLFQYTLSGTGYFEKNGITTPLPAGTGFLISMPDNSRYYLGDEPWELLYLHFTGSAALPFIKKLDALSGGIFALPTDAPPIRRLLAIQKRLTTGGRLEKYEGGEFLYGFLCGLLRGLETPDQGSASLAHRALTLMQERYASLSGVEELARLLGVSPAHLTRCFSAGMGCSPCRYLMRLRLEAAMNDLLNSQESLEKIAGRNGFSCANYFCKVFRATVGMSPTQYRRLKR